MSISSVWLDLDRQPDEGGGLRFAFDDHAKREGLHGRESDR
jgi:hypothetical protein